MSLFSDGYFSMTKWASYNAVMTFILSNRTYGKTWGLQLRAWERARKHGRKTIVIRRFKKEAKAMARKLFRSADLVARLKGFSLYDKKTGAGTFKRVGNTFYIKRNGTWEWFLEIFAASDDNAARAADDVMTDTIVFDEFTTTPQRYAMFRGDEVTNVFDIFFSAKRQHRVNLWFFGNRESINNPYFRELGIDPMPSGWEGVRRYRRKSVLVVYINNKQRGQTEYDRAVENAFRGTRYGRFIYENGYKNERRVKTSKTPLGAVLYARVCVQSTPITIAVENGMFYVKRGIANDNGVVFVDDVRGRYMNEKRLIRSLIPIFKSFILAAADNRVVYENATAEEDAVPFLKWLRIISSR